MQMAIFHFFDNFEGFFIKHMHYLGVVIYLFFHSWKMNMLNRKNGGLEDEFTVVFVQWCNQIHHYMLGVAFRCK